MTGRKSSIVFVAPILLVLARCSALPGVPENTAGGTDVPASADPFIAPFLAAFGSDSSARVGVALRVSAAELTPPEPAYTPTVEPLDSVSAMALLDRLVGPKPSAPALAVPFRFATRSMPAPRPGRTITGAFPGIAADPRLVSAPAVSREPLRVIRTAPRNEIAKASQVSVTFSRPMVSLSALEFVPPGVRLQPAGGGAWRWLDPHTLVYEATEQLPGATHYTVDVPAGIRSADGAVLSNPLRWTFSTAPAAVRDVVSIEAPSMSRPIIAVVFDQGVDPVATLPFLRLEVDSVSIPLQLAGDAELQMPAVRWRLPAAPGRIVAVRALEPLPGKTAQVESKATLRVAAGLPSLEGARRTTTETVHSFLVRNGLQIVDQGCGRAQTCTPGLPWTIRFNHPLRMPPDLGSWVSVEPALPGATIEIWQNHIVVIGDPAENTTYTVRLNPAIATWSGDMLGITPPLRFAVGRPAASAWTPGGGLALIPSNSPPVYTVLAEGTDSVRVQVRAVQLEDWPAYQMFSRQPTRPARTQDSRLPGRLLFSAVLPVIPTEAGTGEALVDLKRALAESDRVVLSATPVAALDTASGARGYAPALTWIERGEVLLDVAADVEALTVRATSSVTGRPLPGVALELLGGAEYGRPLTRLRSASTDANGLAKLMVTQDVRKWFWALHATHEGRTQLFSNVMPGQSWCCPPWEWNPTLRTHIVTDRPIHSPGDTARFTGWLRRADGVGHELSDPAAGATVAYAARDARGQVLVSGVLPILPGGRIEGAILLPVELNSGFASVGLTLHEPERSPQMGGYFSLQIQEVRRPDMELAIQIDPGPHVSGDSLEAALQARYFSGGALPNAEVSWRVWSSPGRYQPPGQPDFFFGWQRYPRAQVFPPVTHTGRTGETGAHRILIHADSVVPDLPMVLRTEATVTDVDRQRRSTSSSVVIHPADVYVGLRSNGRFIRGGETLGVDVLVVDIDGKPTAGRTVSVRAVRQDRRFDQGVLDIHESIKGGCSLRSALSAVPCKFSDLPNGDYLVVAVVEDAGGRHNMSELAVRVAGDAIASTARAAADSLSIVAQRVEYAVGDTAVLLIQATFPTTDAVLSVRRAGVLGTQPFRFENGVAVVRLPIVDAHVPNLQLYAASATADGVLVSGITQLAVSPRARTLQVSVTPSAAVVAPGAPATVTVRVTDQAGRPVPNASVVLSGVDEALYALSRRAINDPIQDFYRRSAPGVIDRSLRSHLATTGSVSARSTARGRGFVTGVVIDGVTGEPVSRAWVQLAGNKDRVQGGWTAANGRYRIDDVDAGAHLLEARAPAYVTGYVSDIQVDRNHARAHFVLWTRNAVLAGDRARRAQLAAPAFQDAQALQLSELTVTAASRAESVAVVPAPAAPPPAERDFSGEAIQTRTADRPLLRTDFSPVAAFVADARTGADGTAAIPIKLPDNLTRYRLRAVVAEGSRRFGVGESSLTARLLLMARLKPPRFLHRGDRFELAVVLENRADSALLVDLAVRALNATVNHPAGKRVSVPARDRLEVRFPAEASETGSARFQIAATAVDSRLNLSDAAEVTVPVLLPAVTEAFAVYGELDDARPVGYPLRLPDGIPGQTRVELGFSNTAVHGLGDAILFLLDCYFDLPEIWASRLLALSSLRESPIAAPVMRDIIDGALRTDVTRLSRLQLMDGGWSLWTARFDADPFVSIHAVNALQRARAAGVKVPDRTITAATQWLERLDEHGSDTLRRFRRAPNQRVFPINYPEQARRAMQAYALDVRRKLGQDVSASAAALLREVGAGALPAEALAWLLPALSTKPEFSADAADVLRELDSRVVRSAGTAALVSPYDAGGRDVLYSARRTDAIVLSALLEVGALPDLTAALARGLMAHRVKGRWSNSLENAYAVAALTGYLHDSEATEPNLIARAWAGSRLAGEQSFRGRSNERAEFSIPADSLGRPGSTMNLVLAREGAGRLYYRVGLKYSSAAPAPALSRGFSVERIYEAVDDPDDVRRDADGTWRVRTGARVRVRLTIAAVGPRYHVAVVDALPAGLEPVNSALAGNEGLLVPGARPPADVGERVWFSAEHVNIKADRFEAFKTLLLPGKRELSYLTLATTPGDFAAPAPRAEEMYAPETLGRGTAGRLIVEASSRAIPRR
ncbi:MAG: carboxypeptidase regulatory-like domain-containing protein [Gemmatimonadota bacterium]